MADKFCSNPFGFSHPRRKIKKKDIHPMTTSKLTEYDKYIPAHGMTMASFLCVKCRLHANKLVQEGKIAENALNLGKKKPRRDSSSSSSSPEAGPSSAMRSTPPSAQGRAEECASMDVSPPSAVLQNIVEEVEDNAELATDEGQGTSQAALAGQVAATTEQPAKGFRRKLQFEMEKEEKTNTSSSSSGETKISHSSSLMSTVAQAKREQLNISLQAFNFSPITKRMTENQRRIGKKVQKMVGGIIEKIQDVSEVEVPPVGDCLDCSQLVESLKSIFPTISEKKQKYQLLTCLPKSMPYRKVASEFSVSIRMARAAAKCKQQKGAFAFPTFAKKGVKVDEELEQRIIQFYLSEENSRVSPSARDSILVKQADGTKKRVAKHLILNNLFDCYQEFKQQNPEFFTQGKHCGITKFASLRPAQCHFPGRSGVHRTCTCEVHENFNILLQLLRKVTEDAISLYYAELESTGQQEVDTIQPSEGGDVKRDEPMRGTGRREETSEPDEEEEDEESDDEDTGLPDAGDEEDMLVFVSQVLSDLDAFIDYMICDEPTDDCVLGYCRKCPRKSSMDTLMNLLEDEEYSFLHWIKTDSVQLEKIIETKDAFELRFRTQVPKIIRHHFIFRMQRDFTKKLRTETIKDGSSACVQVDFAQNYTCVIQGAVQSYHWSAKQVALHPFVAHVWNEEKQLVQYKAYIVISSELSHNASTFHIFRTEFISRFKEDFPHIKQLYYVSDGTGSQYKNTKNLCNLLAHEEDYGIKGNWSFTATSHGKSQCDASSAVVKRTVRLESMKGKLASTAEEVFEIAKNKLSSGTTEFIFVSQEKVAEEMEKLEERYRNTISVKGSRAHHEFKTVDRYTLQMYQYSSSTDFVERVVRKDVVAAVHTAEIQSQERQPEQPHNDEISQPAAKSDKQEEILESVNTQEEQQQLSPKIGDYLAVKIGCTFQVGIVEDYNPEEDDITLRMMKKLRKSFSWPHNNKIEILSSEKVIKQLQAPTTKTGRLYYFTEEELEMEV